MKILINLFLVGLIAVVVYLMLVFVSPETSSMIDDTLGISGMSDTVRGTKNDLDTAITDIPSVNEFQKGANDIKDTVVGGIQTTKDTIDTIRSSGQKIEDGVNTVIDTYDKARDIVNTAGDRMEEIQGVVDTVNQFSETIKPDGGEADTSVETITETSVGGKTE